MTIVLQAPKGLESSGEQFVELFQEKIKEFNDLIETKPVNKNLFLGDGDRNGFLNDFFSCLRELGLDSFLNQVKPQLNYAGGINYLQYFNALAHLPNTDLKRISNIFNQIGSNVERESSYFPREYRLISRYFDHSQNSFRNTGEAGRFVMVMSLASQILTELSEILASHGQFFLARLNQIINCLHGSPQVGCKMSALANVARKTLVTVIEGLGYKKIELPDLVSFLNKLKERRKALLAILIVQSKKRWKVTRSKINEAKEQLKLLEEWHSFVKESPNDFADINKIKSFRSSLKRYNKDIVARMKIYDGFVDRMTKCIEENRIVSSEMQKVLHQLLTTLDKVVSERIPLEPEERIPLQKAQVRIRNLATLHEKQYLKYSQGLGQIPKDLQARFNYLESEVLNTLMRANPTEIKCLSKALLHTYHEVKDRATEDENRVNGVKATEYFRDRVTDLLYTTGRIFKNGILT